MFMVPFAPPTLIAKICLFYGLHSQTVYVNTSVS